LVKFAHARGILHEHSVVIHAIWLDDDDIDLLARTGVTIAHNPICNLRLGSGVAPYYKWRDAGVPICLGSDEALSDDRINIFDVMRMTSLLHTIGQPNWDLWPTPHDVLSHALQGGARALGLKNIGLLREGFQADIVLLDPQSTALSPLNHLARQLVLCEDGRSVKHVFVSGQQVVSDGHLTLIDEASLRREASEIRQRQRQATDTRTVDDLEPFYRQMLDKANKTFHSNWS
jgi:5-methylthioadenosine/S-adenosylhomocysteine deaminase